MVSGRNSRASDLSTQSRGIPRKSGAPQNDMLSSGVLSMLRTTTDMGDIGGLAVNQSRLPKMTAAAMPVPAARRRTNPSHFTEISDHHYAPSQISNRSSRNQPWDTSSMHRRGSVSSLQTTRTGPPYVSDASYQPAMPKMPRNMPYAPSPAPSSQDSRSYSLTQPYHHGLTCLLYTSPSPRD